MSGNNTAAALLLTPQSNHAPQNDCDLCASVANCIGDATQPPTHVLTPYDPEQARNDAAKRRRKKLWQLAPETYCTIIGSCFEHTKLRRFISKYIPDQYRKSGKTGKSAHVVRTPSGKTVTELDDYELHVDACWLARRKNTLSIAMHKELDARYEQSIASTRAIDTPDELITVWRAALQRGEIAPYIWAVMTHPVGNAHTTDIVCRDIHMLQHVALHHFEDNHNQKVDMVDALAEENEVLARNLAEAQRRNTRNTQKNTKALEKLRQELTVLRGQMLQKDSLIVYLEEDADKLRQGIDSSNVVQKKLDKSLMREKALEDKLNHTRDQLKEAESKIKKLEFALSNQQLLEDATHQQTTSAEAALSATTTTSQTLDSESPYFQTEKVLCVGGKNRKVPEYKKVIEQHGATFTHHDGGLEHNQSMLDAALAATDVVICQAGCISHNAYWRVKDYCKRTGKPCIYVDNPSTSSLTKALHKATNTAEHTSESQ